MALVVITIDNTILNVALPTIVRELDATGSQLQWIVDSYVIVFACLLLTAGALGDKYGRKGALDVRRRVVRRVLRAGVVRDLARPAHRLPRAHGHRRRADLPDHAVDPHQHVHRSRAGRGRSASGPASPAIGIAIGPLVGGFLVEHFSWGAVFLVNVPVCTIAFIAAADLRADVA